MHALCVGKAQYNKLLNPTANQRDWCSRNVQAAGQFERYLISHNQQIAS
jgi:hypothetical protein